MPGEDNPTEEIPRQGSSPDPSASTPFLTAGSRLREGRYVLERLLGHGGMAAVWLARDTRLERPVAIKVLSDTLSGEHAYLARFEREARVAAGLSHPNLVAIYDFGAQGGRPFLVMEVIEGGDLAERIEAGAPPDPDRLARELLGALRRIHDAGVLHRDVKARNVLIGDDGRARLTDFGIAQPRDATSLTQTGTVLGTARYLAPELLEGEPPTERSDLYSLGVVLAEASEARPGSAALERLVEDLRSTDPARRPPSAAAALAALDRRAAPLEPTRALRPEATRAAPAPPARSAGPRRTLAIAALAGALVAVLAVVAIAGLGGGSEPDERGGGGERQAQGGGEGRQDAGGGGEEAPSEPQPEPEADPEPSADGYALNDRGYALIQAGRPEEAVPLLERSVEALEGSGDITYAYALYNLGHALRLAGRPEEAIPVLEARLAIPDQREVVREELEAARRAAGLPSGRRANDDD